MSSSKPGASFTRTTSLPKVSGFASAAALAFVLWSTPAVARSPGDKAAADALFEAGRDLMEQGNYDEACPKLKDSFELDPAMGTLLNLGLCYKQAGRTASAWSTYREAASFARQLGDSDREELARSEAEALGSILIRLVIEVSPEARKIEGLQVLRDGELLRDTMWGIGLPVDPGEVTVEASAPGYHARRATVQAVGEGKTIKFIVPMLTREDVAGAAAAPPPVQNEPSQSDQDKVAPPAKDSKSSSRSVGPWVLGGVGLAAVAAGGVFGLLTKGAISRADDVCPDQGQGQAPSGACSFDDISDYDKYVQQAETYRTVSYVTLGVGSAAVLGAVAWALLGGSGRGDSALVVQPQVGGSWGLSARGAF